VAGIRSDVQRQFSSNAAPQRLFHVADPYRALVDGSFAAPESRYLGREAA